ncbi:MAG: lamin tail domain-containing protein [Chloroflexi bacterium]|jgi:hypothetical protein|nr:lamin tail domain-containing protein [Anaerolineaceae bacterium]NMB88127.1 lamin tail domain-containing protein [Chloroflexota bacterium]
MRSWKKLFPFILLNIIVSALTTLGVLWLWDSTQRANLPPVEPVTAAQTPGASLTGQPVSDPEDASATLPPLDEPVLQIQNVFGVGDLDTEVVRLRRLGEGALWLTGWQLQDEDGHTFTFPELLLNKDGAVEVYSRSGTDSVVALHWGQDAPIWRTGELVIVLDPQGSLRASYRIP